MDDKPLLVLHGRFGNQLPMLSTANVVIHQSQFPESIRRDLLKSLRTRRINHKFHYDSVKQTQKWLTLHEACSPARNDKDCQVTYDRAFAESAQHFQRNRVHVIGLGCGGGQKDVRLLKLLSEAGKEVFYTPSDVSTAMVLVARKAALAVVSEKNCLPFVCDLVSADNLNSELDSGCPHRASRVITFFGMIPNFEPQMILPKLASLIRSKDWLLFSANLAPGNAYARGMNQILPQYDNDLTRDWLMTFLRDLGVEDRDGALCFSIEQGQYGLKRVVARYEFKRPMEILIGSNRFKFARGGGMRVFFSYRYTAPRVRNVLQKHELEVCGQWITKSGEEGVFLCRRH